MRRTIPLLIIVLVLLLLLSMLVGGCSSLRQYPSLGTYYVDDIRSTLIEVDKPDTIALLGFADTVEVIDAPIEVRSSDDLFVVKRDGRYGRIFRDDVMSDLLFFSKYTRGRPVLADSSGDRYYRDEFGDTIRIDFFEDAVVPVEVRTDTVATEKPKKKRRKSRRQ